MIVMICGPRTAGWLRLFAGANQTLDRIDQVARLGGQREELAGAGADRPEDHPAVAVAAGWQDGHVRRPLEDRLDQLDGLERVGVEDDEDQIGPNIDDPLVRSLILAADVGEPNLVDAADHSLQRLPRVVDRIDQNDSDRVLQGHGVDSIGGNAPGSELGLPLARDRDSRTDQGGRLGSGTRPALALQLARRGRPRRSETSGPVSWRAVRTPTWRRRTLPGSVRRRDSAGRAGSSPGS